MKEILLIILVSVSSVFSFDVYDVNKLLDLVVGFEIRCDPDITRPYLIPSHCNNGDVADGTYTLQAVLLSSGYYGIVVRYSGGILKEIEVIDKDGKIAMRWDGGEWR